MEEIDHVFTSEEVSVIASTIEDYIKDTKLEIPPSSSRDTYAKACFIIANYQKIGLDTLKAMCNPPAEVKKALEDPLVKSIDANLSFLRIVLPLLRKHFRGF